MAAEESLQPERNEVNEGWGEQRPGQGVASCRDLLRSSSWRNRGYRLPRRNQTVTIKRGYGWCWKKTWSWVVVGALSIQTTSLLLGNKEGRMKGVRLRWMVPVTGRRASPPEKGRDGMRCRRFKDGTVRGVWRWWLHSNILSAVENHWAAREEEEQGTGRKCVMWSGTGG